jgi:alpha-tubulin suppressor-like RCC1 family protein
MILTHHGELYYQRQEKGKDLKTGELTYTTEKFVLVPTQAKNTGDPIVDVAIGNQCFVICTERGQVFGSGEGLHKAVQFHAATYKKNSLFKINVPAKYHTRKVALNNTGNTIFVTSLKDNEHTILSAG